MRRSLRSVVERMAPRYPPRYSRHSEAGDTLIEVLMALVVLSLASVALITAFATTISGSAVHRQLTTSGIVLDSVSQNVIAEIQAQQKWFDCTNNLTLTDYQNPSEVPINIPAPYTNQYQAQITAVAYWNPSPVAPLPTTPGFYPNCVSNQSQLITVTLTQVSNNRTYTNSFVVNTPFSNSAASANSNSGPATHLFISTQPVGGSAGAALATQPVIEVLDVNNQVVTTDLSPVTLALTGTAGATLSGCSGTEDAGVVTFSGCTVDKAGTYQLTVSDGNLPVVTSDTFTVGVAGYHLVFIHQPAGGASGAVMSGQPEVQVQNANGTWNQTWSGTITLATSGGDLTNCPALTVSNGDASFVGCRFAGGYFYNTISKVTLATPYLMTATASGGAAANPATSNTFAVSSFGSAAQMEFSTQPTGVASGAANAVFTVQPVVTVEDSFGNIVTSGYNTQVTLAISTGTLTCSSGNSVTPSGGVATFSGCHGTTYVDGATLTATSGALTPKQSASFNITAAASQLVFTTQPVAGASGTAFITQPVITVEDPAGNVVTSATAAITLTSSGGTLSLCTSLTPNAGVVSVATCNFAGTVGSQYTLTATADGLTGTSGNFSPTGAGAASRLVFTTQPVAGASGSTFTVQPVVKVEDSGGNVVTSSSATITLTSSGGNLTLCSNLTAVTGVVNVSNCTFAGLVGTSYFLTAASGSLTSATSGNFSPSGPGPASQIVLSGCSTSIVSGTTCTATAVIEDSGGNIETADNSSLLTFAQTSGTGSVSGLTSVTASGGAASLLLTAVNAGSVLIDATGDSFVSNTVTLTVIGLAPTVTFTGGTVAGTTPNQTATFTVPSGGGTYTAAANTNSGGTISYSTASPGCSVVAGTGVVSFTTLANCVITATTTASGTYTAGSANLTITVTGRAPTVTFTGGTVAGTTPNQTATTTAAGYTAAANTNSGGTISYSSVSPGCSVVAGTGVVSFTTLANCVITATTTASGTYTAGSATLTITVSAQAGTPSGFAILGVPGTQDGKPDAGDQVVFTYSQVMSANSIMSGFTGSSTAVFVQLTRTTGNSSVLQICQTGTCSAAVNLGSVSLGDPTGNRYLGSGTTAYLNATMSMTTVGGRSVVTVTLGTLISGTITALAPTSTTTTLTWTPSGAATNLGGTASSTTAVNESPAKANF